MLKNVFSKEILIMSHIRLSGDFVSGLVKKKLFISGRISKKIHLKLTKSGRN